MSDAHDHDQIAELLAEAGGLPFGPAKVALLEEAVRHADTAGNLELGFDVRDELMEAANFSGRPDIMLIAFSWCLAQFDADPERHDSEAILWKYKWVLSNVFSFPEISRSRIEALLADMKRRYGEFGSTMHAFAQERRDFHVNIGEREAAKKAHVQTRGLHRDSLSNCQACIASNNCDYFIFLRQWGRAVQAAQPVLRNRLCCAEEPHRILAKVLLPLLRLGRTDEARDYQRQGYRLVSAGPQFIAQHAEHLEFVVLIGDMAPAKRLVERHLPGALASVELDNLFAFLLAARLWTDRLLSRGKRTVKVRLPKGLPEPDADGKSDVAALGDWFLAKAQEIGRRFDKRNGTRKFQETIDELPDLLRLAIG